MTSQDPAMETGFDPDINRKRPQNPDRPLPTSRTSRGIDRSAFSIGKNCAAKITQGICMGNNIKLLICSDEYCFKIVFADESRTKIKRGKVTLEKAQEMISTHRADLEKNTPTLLAQYYKLDLGRKYLFCATNFCTTYCTALILLT